MNNYSMIIILCEDRQHEVFMRTFLVNRGVPPRRIRVKIAPAGEGSGEQYVRSAYPDEVKTYRGKRNYLNIALTVMIDADTKQVENRLDELDASLPTADLDRRRPDERIGIFIPRRNIETWIHFLLGEKVDEVTAYSKFQKPSECKKVVKELARMCGQTLEGDAPPSLRTACKELQRIF